MLQVSILLLLLSLLSVHSLNCLHGANPINSTKVSCLVKQRWCYSIQKAHSDQVLFGNRGCDERGMCERLKYVGREVAQLLPPLPHFTAHFFCFEAMNQSICCCDRDNCNSGTVELVMKPLAPSSTTSFQFIRAILPALIILNAV